MDAGIVHRAVCLFTSQLLLVLIAPSHGGMARLSLPVCWRWLFFLYCQAHFDALHLSSAPASVQHITDILEFIHSKKFLQMLNLATLLRFMM